MSEIEDVSRLPTCLIEDSLRLRAQHIRFRKQRHRIEISHYRYVMTDTLPAFVESDAPVESNHIAAGFAHQLQQRSRAGAEMNHRNTRHNIPNHIPRMRQNKLAIIIGTQTTN